MINFLRILCSKHILLGLNFRYNSAEAKGTIDITEAVEMSLKDMAEEAGLDFSELS